MSDPLSYADHDVHHVSHRLEWLSGADSGPDDSYRDTRQYQITRRGLDPDELAELRAIRAQYAMDVRVSGSQSEPGSVSAKIGAGYNLSGSELLSADPSFENVDVDDSGTPDYQVEFTDTDEVGQLLSTRASTIVPWGDDTNGDGGGVALATDSETIDYTELTGSGPVVDAVDDFVSSIELVVRNTVETVAITTNYVLYYAVEESESGRTRFGR